jgi:hypothetical protein
MLGLFGRRNRRTRIAVAARFVVEVLESRKLFDVTTFSAIDPYGQYAGVSNSMDPLNTWTHSWHLTQMNVPAHTHAELYLQAATESHAFYQNGDTTYSDTPADAGPAWIKVYCNGDLAADWETDDSSSASGQQLVNNAGNWLSAQDQDGGASTVVWDVETSDNVYLQVIDGSAGAGTYAGFANSSAATRGGSGNGSVDISLDGQCEQGIDVFFDMPDNVVLNIGGGLSDPNLPPCPQSGLQPYAALSRSIRWSSRHRWGPLLRCRG